MDGIRLLSRWMPSLTAAALLVVAPATSALAGPAPWSAPPPGVSLTQRSALADPPDVRGLSVTDAQKVLLDWDKSVVIQQVPQQLPAGVDESTVVVATATLLSQQTPGSAGNRPVVRLTLGSRVPDLTGLTSAAAAQALAARGLRLQRPSPQTQPTWVVTTQQVPPGSIVEFGLSVTATFAAPDTGPSTVVLVGAAGLGLVLLALATALGIRSARRRARRRKDRPTIAAVRLDTYPGQVVGPDLTERTGSVSVRLQPHPDRGTVSLEEVRR